jgi:hypothetical protein
MKLAASAVVVFVDHLTNRLNSGQWSYPIIDERRKVVDALFPEAQPQTTAPLKVLCFFPGTQFEEARRRYSDYANLTFDQYLDGQELAAAELTTQGNAVMIREVDWGDFDEFATQSGLDPYDPQTLTRFPGSEHTYDGPGTLVAIHMADAAFRLVVECANYYGVGLDNYYPISQEVWSTLRAHWQRAVHSRAVLTFATVAPTAEGGYPVTTDLDLVNLDGMIELPTAAHVAMLENLILLGCINGGGLIMRSFDPEDPDADEDTPLTKTVYGWTLGPNGLGGLTQSSLIEACMSGDENGPREPDSTTTYRSTT